tara:strand:+ start:70 stop:318 length:249 start_codon:yes stop_codon:yes gene_type:complete
MSRQAHSTIWWSIEYTYLRTVELDNVGRNFNYDPAVFAKYCNMQARFAQRDGFFDLSERIFAIADDANRYAFPAILPIGVRT